MVVLPAGYRRTWNAGGCCGAAGAASVDDVTFLTRLVGQVLADTPDADRGRIFLAGLSNGGRLAYRMACRRPTLFSAVAVVEAVPVELCPAVAAPVPLLVVSSTGDPLLRQAAPAPRHVIDGVAQPSSTALSTPGGCSTGAAHPRRTSGSVSWWHGAGSAAGTASPWSWTGTPVAATAGRVAAG